MRFANREQSTAKRKAQAFLLLLAVAVASPAWSSGIPEIDTAKTAIQALKNLKNSQEMTKIIDTLKKAQEQYANFKGASTDGVNNAAANTIVRLNQARADIFNIKQEMEDQPAASACGTARNSRAAGQATELAEVADCVLNERLSSESLLGFDFRPPFMRKEVNSQDSEEAASTGGGSSEKTSSEAGAPERKTASQRVREHPHRERERAILERAAALPQPSDSADSPPPPIVMDPPSPADLTGLYAGARTLTPEGHQRALDFAYIIAPPAEITVDTSKLREDERVQMLRHIMLQNSAHQAMLGIIAERTAAPGEISRFEAIEAAARLLVIDEGQDGNTVIERINLLSTPTQALREMASAKALQLYTMVRMLEHNLVREYLLANQLSRKLDETGTWPEEL